MQKQDIRQQHMHKRRKKRRSRLPLLFLVMVLIAGAYYGLRYIGLLPARSYTASHFGIETLESELDQDGDGKDDFEDIMEGARSYVRTRPKYESVYYEGGYPDGNVGVCTDVIWSAFQEAGYDLKAMVDEDIAAHTAAYPRVTGRPDRNIDFRRVPNLLVFFQRNAQTLTLDPSDLEAWQPGDIVVYKDHIAIVSEKRNSRGIPFIIHHGGQPVYEEDSMTRQKIIGHFRWIGGK